MTRTHKLWLGIGVIAVCFVIGVAALTVFRSSNSESGTSYQPSDEVLSPYELSKNPYKYKGRSRILDTLHVPLEGPNGKGLTVPYPGGGLRFANMLDEHTAVYSVLVASYSVVPDGEIAVILPDSNPPDSLRSWQVFVEGPLEAINGFGAKVKLTVVRFEGYHDLPSVPVESNRQPAQLPAPSVAPPNEPTQAAPDNGLMEPAPVEPRKSEPSDIDPPQSPDSEPQAMGLLIF